MQNELCYILVDPDQDYDQTSQILGVFPDCLLAINYAKEKVLPNSDRYYYLNETYAYSGGGILEVQVWEGSTFHHDRTVYIPWEREDGDPKKKRVASN